MKRELGEDVDGFLERFKDISLTLNSAGVEFVRGGDYVSIEKSLTPEQAETIKMKDQEIAEAKKLLSKLKEVTKKGAGNHKKVGDNDHVFKDGTKIIGEKGSKKLVFSDGTPVNKNTYKTIKSANEAYQEISKQEAKKGIDQINNTLAIDPETFKNGREEFTTPRGSAS